MQSLIEAQRMLEAHVRRVAVFRGAREEERARAVMLEWLPAPLRRLVDHPRLLRLYIRLPHRRRPVAIQHFDGRIEFTLD